VNPFGKLPALSHGDVHIIESGAILLYLHDLYSSDTSAAARGRAASWVLFANSTMGNGLYLEHLRPKELPVIMAGLTSTFADGQHFLEPQGFTVADVAVGGLLLYLPFMFPELDLTPFPAVLAYMNRLAQRPAFQATLGARLASGPAAPPTRGGTPVS
jgi:glutathione S-transferase